MPKKPTPEPEACGSCKFFQPNQHDNFGWCRRYPPVSFMTENGLSAAQSQTSADEWCGEFSRRLNA